MATKSLHSLGAMVRKRRGERKLREVAKDIGISAPTLLRIEEEPFADVATFGKVCKWLGIDPKSLLGIEDAQVPAGQSGQSQGFDDFRTLQGRQDAEGGNHSGVSYVAGFCCSRIRKRPGYNGWRRLREDSRRGQSERPVPFVTN